MNLNGRCACGRVTFRIQGTPLLQVICHCPSCQLAHAAPLVRGAQFPAESVEVWGTVMPITVSDQPAATRRMTCPSCGTRVFNGDGPGVRTFFPELCAPRKWFEPQMHLYWSNRQVELVDELPKYLDFPIELGGSGRLATSAR